MSMTVSIFLEGRIRNPGFFEGPMINNLFSFVGGG